MFILGLVETSRDPPELFVLPKNLRIALRLPIAIIIVLLSLAELNTTLLMGLVTMLLGILLILKVLLELLDHVYLIQQDLRRIPTPIPTPIPIPIMIITIPMSIPIRIGFR